MPPSQDNHSGVATRLTADAFTAAGFRISVISEPQPVPAAREVDPEGFRMLSNNPSFPFFVLHANGVRDSQHQDGGS